MAAVGRGSCKSRYTELQVALSDDHTRRGVASVDAQVIPTRAAPSVPHELSARPSAAGPDATFSLSHGSVCGGVCARARACVCVFVYGPSIGLRVAGSSLRGGARASALRRKLPTRSAIGLSEFGLVMGRREVVCSKNDPEKCR